MLGDRTPHHPAPHPGFFLLHVLQVKCSWSFVSNYFSQMCIKWNSLWSWRYGLFPEQRSGMLSNQYNKDNISYWSEGQVCLLPIRKDLGSLNWVFLSWNATLCVCKCSPSYFTLSCGNWGTEKQCKIGDTQVTVNNKLSFHFDSGVSCLLPTSKNCGCYLQICLSLVSFTVLGT